VRIYMEDGTYAVSDEQGKYSLYGLIPRLHVAKVDLTTLPPVRVLRCSATAMRWMQGACSSTHRGELHKADFALSACSASLREEIAVRRRALTHPSEILQARAACGQRMRRPQRSMRAHCRERFHPVARESQSAVGAAPAAPQVAMASAMPGIAPFAPLWLRSVR